ncbi:hypothetical protein [Cetobacterium sp.]|uniref:hypothetical protein n=1 Tax=Cetobacterium sp. TaxID=2071632 RepID=UPI003F2D9300
MLSIKKSFLCKTNLKNGGIQVLGSNRTGKATSEYSDGEILNESPETSFQNIKAGDVFNLFEDVVLNSKWDIRDNENGSTIVLAREHMFYEEVQNEKEKIDKLIDNVELEGFSFECNPINLFNKACSVLVDNGITQGFDQTTEAILKKGTEKTDTLKKVLDRDSVRKFSEIHYAFSGFNLIYSDISINEDVFNTVSYSYTQSENSNDSDFTVMVSLIPENSSRYIREASVSPPYDFCDYLRSVENLNRNIEYFENVLLKNLENSYGGKIFIKYNPDIEIDDKIVLVDNINSTNGIFKVSTYEHRFTNDGLVTVVNVKACVSITDPALDVYSLNYLMNLHKDLKDEIKKDENSNLGNDIVFTNIFSSVAKVMYQIPKYGMFYNKEDKWFLDNEYPIKDNNVRANSLPIKFYPIIKKGKTYLPENIETCFYSTELENQGFMSALLKNIRTSVTGMFQDGVEFTLGTIRYTLDFLISMPTFGLHELIKPALGIQYGKMMSTFEDDNLTNNQIDMLIDNENFYSDNLELGNPSNYRNQEKNAEYIVSFFNMKAQQESGLFTWKNDELSKSISDGKILEKLKIKESVSSMIANYSCDTLFAVEIYDGFRIDRFNYTHNNFIKNVFGEIEAKHIISSNKYGNEYGVIYSSNKEKYNSYFDKNNKTIEIGNGKKAVVCEMNVEDFKYGLFAPNHPQLITEDVRRYINSVKKIKFVWLHNYYGSDPTAPDERKNIFYNVLKSANGMVENDTGVIIVGDFNLQIDNNRVGNKTPATSTNQNIVLTERDGFRSCIDKPTTLSSTSGSKFVNQFDNVLISNNLVEFYDKGLIKTDINKYYAPNGVDRRDVSDHLPVFIIFKKNK